MESGRGEIFRSDPKISLILYPPVHLIFHSRHVDVTGQLHSAQEKVPLTPPSYRKIPLIPHPSTPHEARKLALKLTTALNVDGTQMQNRCMRCNGDANFACNLHLFHLVASNSDP